MDPLVISLSEQKPVGRRCDIFGRAFQVEKAKWDGLVPTENQRHGELMIK